MEHAEGTFRGERGTSIWYQRWRPEGPKAAIALAHGLGEHSGRYGNVVGFLGPRGYALYGLDLRGHGHSGGQRGHVERFDDYTADYGRLVGLVRAEEPGLPVYLYGHSLGGLIALRYAIDHPEGLAGVIGSGPALRRRFDVPLPKLLLAGLLSALWPTFTLRSGLPAEQLSHDPQVVAAYRADPLVHDLVTPRLYTEVTSAYAQMLVDAPRLKVPCLLLQAAEDALVDPESTRQFHERLAVQDKTLHVYEGFRHEGHNEPGRGCWLGDLAAWLDAHASAQAGPGDAA